MRQQMSSAKEKWPAHSGSSRNVSPLRLTLVSQRSATQAGRGVGGDAQPSQWWQTGAFNLFKN